ncbi:hypothetical protein pb186bvf_010327 [Paramecium bursaria]
MGCTNSKKNQKKCDSIIIRATKTTGLTSNSQFESKRDSNQRSEINKDEWRKRVRQVNEERLNKIRENPSLREQKQIHSDLKDIYLRKLNEADQLRAQFDKGQFNKPSNKRFVNEIRARRETAQSIVNVPKNQYWKMIFDYLSQNFILTTEHLDLVFHIQEFQKPKVKVKLF